MSVLFLFRLLVTASIVNSHTIYLSMSFGVDWYWFSAIRQTSKKIQGFEELIHFHLANSCGRILNIVDLNRKMQFWLMN